MESLWWEDSEEEKKIRWRSWNRMCIPKSERGMGFRDLESFNDALLGKQCWRILCNPNALWVQVLKARLLP